jgi:molybdenum cofactor synthesis domain-containing protein
VSVRLDSTNFNRCHFIVGTNAIRLTYAKRVDLAAKILTVSDSVVAGSREDTAGPRLATLLEEHGYAVVERRAVADGIEPVALVLREMVADFSGLLVTTGGTGFSPRDLTPEATMTVVDREAPGLAEAMRLTNPLGRLSRARAGTIGNCLILNTPGSPRGATEYLEAVLDVLGHALELLGGDQDQLHPPEIGGSTAV